jgi:hypothetical protein
MDQLHFQIGGRIARQIRERKISASDALAYFPRAYNPRINAIIWLVSFVPP